mmetsp:Transcript_25575/g.12111  ORF Transcript_25575/g.12111 Transcript_25575/m.12111 type:complete len:93 (+) Transcript_25575:277-555(+)
MYIEPLADNKHLYKVFAEVDTPLDRIFKTIDKTYVQHWYGVPILKETQDLGRFLLSSGIYYVSSLESISSSLELQCVAAKNVALMIYHHFQS